MGGSTPGVPRRPALPSGGHRQMRWTAGRQDPPPCPEARAGFALEASVLEEEEEEEEVKIIRGAWTPSSPSSPRPRQTFGRRGASHKGRCDDYSP
ncbi:unnamed protein product [Prorocentrum cordatum]|nr:unnamed protein product [Polarella glacialis]